VKENKELTTSCANSEPSLHNAHITPAENENTCNAYGAALTQGENSFGVSNLSTDHAIIEQHLLESFFMICLYRKVICLMFLVIKKSCVIVLHLCPCRN
jgi:hypothetical protein